MTFTQACVSAVCFSAAFPALAGANACLASAPLAPPALVELFTSEGCDSCPPADRWLAELSVSADSRQVIPLAFHVSYWDYLGWSDPYARKEFDQRHDRLAYLGAGKKLYTPQVFVDGRELRDWRRLGALEARRKSVAARPAGGQLHIRWTPRADGLEVELRGELGQGKAGLEWAIVQSGLESAIARGENAGKTLRHDHVVRVWRSLGEVTRGSFIARDEIVWPEGVKRENSRVVAWLAHEGPGGLQAALSAPLLCERGS